MKDHSSKQLRSCRKRRVLYGVCLVCLLVGYFGLFNGAYRIDASLSEKGVSRHQTTQYFLYTELYSRSWVAPDNQMMEAYKDRIWGKARRGSGGFSVTLERWQGLGLVWRTRTFHYGKE